MILVFIQWYLKIFLHIWAWCYHQFGSFCPNEAAFTPILWWLFSCSVFCWLMDFIRHTKYISLFFTRDFAALWISDVCSQWLDQTIITIKVNSRMKNHVFEKVLEQFVPLTSAQIIHCLSVATRKKCSFEKCNIFLVQKWGHFLCGKLPVSSWSWSWSYPAMFLASRTGKIFAIQARLNICQILSPVEGRGVT